MLELSNKTNLLEENDYKYSLAEAVLYTISLMNNGVYDFTMRDKAILAFENFITED